MPTALTMLFVFLPASVTVLAGVMAGLVVREAFADPRAARRRVALPVSLPLLAGDGLRRWAAEWAERAVAARLAARASRQAAVALAQEVEAEVSQVIERSLPAASLVPAPACSDSSPQTILVTAPETLAIVDELEQHVSPRELRRIRQRAQSNLQQLSQAPAEANAATVCPLLADDGRCAIFAARPLDCRGRCCPNCDQPGGAERAAGAASQSFAATFGAGISAGLSEGLTKAGFDGRRYELNRALVEVLGTPEAGRRWLRGEAVFTACPEL